MAALYRCCLLVEFLYLDYSHHNAPPHSFLYLLFQKSADPELDRPRPIQSCGPNHSDLSLIGINRSKADQGSALDPPIQI